MFAIFPIIDLLPFLSQWLKSNFPCVSWEVAQHLNNWRNWFEKHEFEYWRLADLLGCKQWNKLQINVKESDVVQLIPALRVEQYTEVW